MRLALRIVPSCESSTDGAPSCESSIGGQAEPADSHAAPVRPSVPQDICGRRGPLVVVRNEAPPRMDSEQNRGGQVEDAESHQAVHRPSLPQRAASRHGRLRRCALSRVTLTMRHTHL
jgi:hypothetical protein